MFSGSNGNKNRLLHLSKTWPKQNYSYHILYTSTIMTKVLPVDDTIKKKLQKVEAKLLVDI